MKIAIDIDDIYTHIKSYNDLGIKIILFNNIDEYDELQANNWLDVKKF